MNNDPLTPNPNPNPRLDLDEIARKLRGKKGPAYWKGLEEVAETEEFQAWIEDEFPNRRDLATLDRRTFLKFMGASLALAGLSGCRGVFMPVEHLVPYVIQPESELIGEPLYYATTLPHKGYGFGILCSQREGRPIKIEGNPTHPASLGSVDSILLAEILTFYDPDRLDNVMQQGNIGTWDQFVEDAQTAVKAQKVKKGSGLRILTENATSPTVTAQIQKLLAEYPLAKWHVYDPVDNEGARIGNASAFGKYLDVHYNLSKANVVVSLDSDFMLRRPDSVSLMRQWSDGRRITGTEGTLNRLYCIESSLSITGAAADHRWPVRPSEIHGVAASLAAALGISVAGGSSVILAKEIQAIATDLQANPGASVVIPGEGQTAAVHAICAAINEKLGAFGTTVTLTNPIDSKPESRVQSMTDLVNDLNQQLVDAIIIVGGNPVYNAPADLSFGSAVSKAKFKAYLSLYETETSNFCDYTVPMTHPLECWGDWMAYDGTISLQQPLISPLHDGWSMQEFFSALTGDKEDGYTIIRKHYSQAPHKLSDDDFKKALYAGFLAGSAPSISNLSVNPSAILPPSNTGASALEIKFKPCGKIWDGSYSNNGWLRELPDQITKLTWDTVIEISPKMAKDQNIDSGNTIEITTNLGSIIGPAFIQPGQPDGAVSVTLGYGRTMGGVVALESDSVGYNAYSIRPKGSMGFLAGPDNPTIVNQGGDYRFANVQLHWSMEGRDIIRQGTLQELKTAVANNEEPFKFKDEGIAPNLTELNMYPAQIFDWKGEQWGMTIDLTTCTGCNACVTACQAENNIPVVGKDQVARGREMHWLRMDRYYGPNNAADNESDTEFDNIAILANPTVVYQPVACMMCEKAPCEPVCPVAATVHSHDGLNQMVYNRCIGTRYCSDNCPYKVRRFNFLNYQMAQPNFGEVKDIPLLKLFNNPDVTVRGRGVMEKCTYCVQRISDARIEAKKAGLPIRDGAIITACQQACPTKTITFGNIEDPKAKVSAIRKDPRNYKLLEDLNTRPRTSYLGRLRNPNPEIN